MPAVSDSAVAGQFDVLLFASVADAFGSPVLRLTLAAGPTARAVCDAVRAAAAALPSAPRLPATLRLAVNQAIVDDAAIVDPRDELAIIPPVAGG